MTADDNGDANPPGGSTPSSTGPQKDDQVVKAQADEADNEEVERAANLVPADMQMFIGRQLRAVYDDVAKQPIPDRFLELMKQLESKTA